MSAVLRHGSTATDGFALRITPESAGWGFSGLRILALEAGDSQAFDTGEDELVVVPLDRACTVTVDGDRFDLAGRAGVFAGVTDVL
jgi:5-deoxy-glucuronate isomerase